MSLTRKKLMALIDKNYPNLNLDTSENFNSRKGGVWVRGTEDGICGRNGLLLFNYYAQGEFFEFGVNTELVQYLYCYGWFAEWNDAGTIMFWKA